ncbi:MAG TPA: hypothetical protein VK249_05960 [Anaerolineales bacterium]|nr:hypothetical protein [Anaerolineales bacterium]
MNKQLISIALILILGACLPTPTTVPGLPDPAANIPTAASSATAVPQNAVPATPVQPTEASVPATETTGTLGLQILSPQDEAVLNVPQVDVSGLAPAGTVVSVNDEILIVGAEGQFKITISLDEGPNLLEIVASDESGNEASSILTVTYEP